MVSRSYELSFFVHAQIKSFLYFVKRGRKQIRTTYCMIWGSGTELCRLFCLARLLQLDWYPLTICPFLLDYYRLQWGPCKNDNAVSSSKVLTNTTNSHKRRVSGWKSIEYGITCLQNSVTEVSANAESQIHVRYAWLVLEIECLISLASSHMTTWSLSVALAVQKVLSGSGRAGRLRPMGKYRILPSIVRTFLSQFWS